MNLLLKLRRKTSFKRKTQKLLQPEFWTYLYCNEFYKIVCDTGLDSYSALQIVDRAFFLAQMSLEKYSGKITERVWLLGFLHAEIKDYTLQNPQLETGFAV